MQAGRQKTQGKQPFTDTATSTDREGDQDIEIDIAKHIQADTWTVRHRQTYKDSNIQTCMWKQRQTHTHTKH